MCGLTTKGDFLPFNSMCIDGEFNGFFFCFHDISPAVPIQIYEVKRGFPQMPSNLAKAFPGKAPQTYWKAFNIAADLLGKFSTRLRTIFHSDPF